MFCWTENEIHITSITPLPAHNWAQCRTRMSRRPDIEELTVTQHNCRDNHSIHHNVTTIGRHFIQWNIFINSIVFFIKYKNSMFFMILDQNRVSKASLKLYVLCKVLHKQTIFQSAYRYKGLCTCRVWCCGPWQCCTRTPGPGWE